MSAPIRISDHQVQSHPAGPKAASRTILLFEPSIRGAITVAVDDEHGRWHRQYSSTRFALQAGIEQACRSVRYQLRRQKHQRNPMVGSDAAAAPGLPVQLTVLMTATYDQFDLDLFVELAHDPSRWSRTGRHAAQLAGDIVDRLESHPLDLDAPFGAQVPDPTDIIPEHQNCIRSPQESVQPQVIHSDVEFARNELIAQIKRRESGTDLMHLTNPQADPPRPTPLIPATGFPEAIDAFITGSEERIRDLMEIESDLRRQIKDARNERASLGAARDAYLKRRTAS